MRLRRATAAMATFCAIIAFDSFPAGAAPSKTVEANDLDGAGDHPGDWMLEFKSTDKKGFQSTGFVRLLRSRDARGMVKYDEIVMHSDRRYPFGLWDTYLGRCDSHAIADIWAGEVNADGDSHGFPVTKIEYVPQPKHFTGYDTLEKLCNGVAMQTVTDPIAYAHDFLKR